MFMQVEVFVISFIVPFSASLPVFTALFLVVSHAHTYIYPSLHHTISTLQLEGQLDEARRALSALRQELDAQRVLYKEV